MSKSQIMMYDSGQVPNVSFESTIQPQIADIGETMRAENQAADVGNPISINSTLDKTFAAKMKPFVINEVGTAHSVTAQYAPTEFEDGVEVQYERFSSQGSSYAHMQYENTKNYVMEVDLYWSAGDRPVGAAAMDSSIARRRILSWCYPRLRGGWSYGPPRLQASWPMVSNFYCYLIECKFKNQRFALTGEITRWVASIKLEECRTKFAECSYIAEASGLIGGDNVGHNGSREE